MSKTLNNSLLLVLGWCLVTAFAYVFIGSVQQQYMPITMCFYVFLISALFFFIFNIKRLPKLFRKIKIFYKEVVNINLITLFCWLSFFYALKYIEPAIVAAIIWGSRVVILVLFEKWFCSINVRSIKHYVVNGLIVLAMLYLVWVCLSQHSAVEVHHSLMQIGFGVISSIVSGAMLAAGSIMIRRLNLAGFSGADIMSVRFVFLILLTGMIYYFFIPRAINDFHFGEVVFIAALSLVLVPQSLLQAASERQQPMIIAMLLSVMPVVVFFLEFADHRLTTSLWTLVGVLAISALTAYSAKLRYLVVFGDGRSGGI